MPTFKQSASSAIDSIKNKLGFGEKTPSVHNKLFESADFLKGSQMVSKVKMNREYLLSKQTAEEFNTYLSFSPFPTFNDYYSPQYDKKGEEIYTSSSQVGTPGVRSLFSKLGAMVIGDGSASGWEAGQLANMTASEWRISNNVPLMDNRETRKKIKQNSGCTVKELVQASQNGELGRNTYSFSDFMYCKYLGRLSNNYLITLRRFPYPVDDFISAVGVGENRANKDFQTKTTDSIGCLVTWMGTPGNEISNVLKYSFNMPFKEQKAEMQNNTIDADSNKGILNSIASAFDPTYRQQFQDGQAGAALQNYVGKMFAIGDAPYPASQWNSFRDQTKVYGPVDTIKSTYMRSEEGLNFDQTFNLVFDYELRSYNGINPRQAMLDLISNILNVTYSTGTFWGGGYRGGGAHQSNIFANMNIFKARGGFTNFIDAFQQDASNLMKSAGNIIDKNGGLLNTLGKIANTLGGMLLSGGLNALGRPQKQLLNSLLSPAPIGFWHITIGNPHHPIMSVGNLILKSTEVEHYGPLGLDDFPTGLRVKCQLQRGKPRDIRDIEKLYMHGNDRIYSSMGPKIFDMYKYSKEYKKNYKSSVPVIGNADSEIKIGEGKDSSTVKIENIEQMKHVLQKHFGHADTNSIIIASMEQEMGSQKKKKKGVAGGDSSAQGNR